MTNLGASDIGGLMSEFAVDSLATMANPTNLGVANFLGYVFQQCLHTKMLRIDAVAKVA